MNENEAVSSGEERHSLWHTTLVEDEKLYESVKPLLSRSTCVQNSNYFTTFSVPLQPHKWALGTHKLGAENWHV